MKIKIKHPSICNYPTIFQIVFVAFFTLSNLSILKSQIEIPGEIKMNAKEIAEDSELLKKPHGMAMDEINEILFIADPGSNSVLSYDIKTDKLKVIMQNRDVEPEFIAIDPIFETIFWTDKKFASIHRMNYEGRNPMNIYSRRKTKPEYIQFDRKSRKLIWVDSRNKLINETDPMGNSTRELYWAKNHIIKGLSLGKEGLIYFAAQSPENARMPFRTIYSFKSQSKKLTPIWNNCSNEINSMDYNLESNSLLCTDKYSNAIKMYSIGDSLVRDTIIMERVLANILFVGSQQFYWTDDASSNVYFTDLHLYKRDLEEREQQIKKKIALKKKQTVEKWIRDSIRRSHESEIVKNEIDHQIDLIEASENISKDQYASIGNLNRIFRIKFRAEGSRKSQIAYLLDIDQESMRTIHLEYFGPFNFPESIAMDQVNQISTKSIKKIEILYEIQFSNQRNYNNDYVKKLMKKERSRRFLKTLSIWGGVGLGLDILTGTITYAPVFTITGGIIGLIAGVVRTITVTSDIAYKEEAFSKFHVVDYKKNDYKIDLQTGAWATKVKQAALYSFKGLE